MSEFLFIYGTLRPGAAPPEIADAAAQLCFVGEGYVHGRLYDLGHYPGAVLDGNLESSVCGAVFALPEDAAVLRALDEYEEFNSSAPEASEFLRTRARVMMAAGCLLECWIYVYNGGVAGAPVIESGVWQRRSS